MVEQNVLHRPGIEQISHEEAKTTFNNMLTGYQEKRVGSAALFGCLKEVVKISDIYGLDTRDVLATNAKRIQQTAYEKNDPFVALEAVTLVDFAKAVKKIPDGKVSYQDAADASESATQKYISGEAGSAAVVKSLVDAVAIGIHAQADNNDLLKKTQREAQQKGDVRLARQCNVLVDFAPLMATKAKGAEVRAPQSELIAA